MKAFNLFMVVMLLVGINTAKAQVKTIEGVEFPIEMTINGQNTVLNGGGLREKLGFLDLYVGALYLPSKSSDASEIILADQAMGIRIVIASKLVTRDRFIEALEEGFDNTTVGSYTATDIERFKEFLSDAFEPNDEILLVYDSEQGTQLYKNGEVRGSFAGLPFKQALFGIWLGDKPAQESLKKHMFGL